MKVSIKIAPGVDIADGVRMVASALTHKMNIIETSRHTGVMVEFSSEDVMATLYPPSKVNKEDLWFLVEQNNQADNERKDHQ